MLFSKEHLTGLYTWVSSNANDTFEGEPSRRLFDRWNGDQVLFIIKQVMENTGDLSIEHGKKLEGLIINKLPFDPCSELTVFNWLQKEMLVNA
jgi:hypothetical protein